MKYNLDGKKQQNPKLRVKDVAYYLGLVQFNVLREEWEST